jgi:1-phosphofructokinase family hexose kinase
MWFIGAAAVTILNTAHVPLWCVSPNPAIDKRMRITTLLPGHVNRVREVRGDPGGKAAHVAMVLQTLGAKPLWFGFAGGATGEQLLNGLHGLGITAQSVSITEDTRINLEIIDDAGGVTEVLEPGPATTQNDWENFFAAFDKILSQPSPGIVIASGSLPPGSEPGSYARLTELAHRYGHKLFLDSSGEPLRLALSAGPDFIKPNREEAEQLIGEKIRDRSAAQRAVAKLVQLGARSAAVSLGQDGFVWQATDGKAPYHAQLPSVGGNSTVGCGDSTVAAFAYAMATGLGVQQTLQLAAACGAANCLAPAPGRLLESDMCELLAQVRVEQLPGSLADQ